MIEACAVERQAGVNCVVQRLKFEAEISQALRRILLSESEESGRRGATNAVDLLNDSRRVFERVTLGPDVCRLVTD